LTALPLLTSILFLATACGSGTVHLSSATPPAAAQSTCRTLLDHLPAKVAGQSRRDDDATWAAGWGDPPITLTCGVPRPSGFVAGSPCTTVNGVDWFIPQDQLNSSVPVDLTLTAIYREVYLQVELPKDYWPPATALADLSGVVKSRDPAAGHCR
jgi:hypothetical protein